MEAKFFSSIDWMLLRNQKETLLNMPVNDWHRVDVDGVINLIDGIQDYAADILHLDEVEIFGPEIAENRAETAFNYSHPELNP
jgi:hypothetical protein